ncbi:hypothetical protein SAMN04487869_12616 [Marinobacter sp. DSM 26671]|nr:hypothetical protein SAMN04487869_12616 [Marinobacter sp. DSM 26671]
MSSESTDRTLTQNDQIGLRTVIRIMDKWGLDTACQAQLIHVDSETLSSPQSLPCFNNEQRSRVSYLLNIHASLRDLFQNPENQYGFMSAVNHNPPFYGQSPLDLILSGEPSALKEVFYHLERVKYGQ